MRSRVAVSAAPAQQAQVFVLRGAAAAVGDLAGKVLQGKQTVGLAALLRSVDE